MIILNVSLCLPALDVFALRQKHSIVAVTKRFIVPGKTFALLPCRDVLETAQLVERYQPSFLAHVKADVAPLAVTHWASCVLCQQLIEEHVVEAIAPRTVWTKAALSQQWQEGSASLKGNSLFLAFLQVYALPEALDIETAPACEQLYKFVPLPHHIEVTTQEPVLSSEEFVAAKEQFLSSEQDGLQPNPPPNSEEKVSILPTIEEILESSDWAEKIAEYGNSSDGHTFEKLVRKGFIELGFSNSSEQLAASLNPKATGGAGGLDFYADQPYKIVGECKASKKQRIDSDAATQLVRLGLQNLQHDEYSNCVKIVIAAGQLTAGAEQIARGHRINIIRPEVMQRLVTSKLTLENDFDLFQLKGALETEPFGEKANQKVDKHIDWCLSEWAERREYRQLVEQTINTLKELSKQSIASPSQDFSTVEIRAHHNAKYQPIVTTAKMNQILEYQYIQGSFINRRAYAGGSIGYYLRN